MKAKPLLLALTGLEWAGDSDEIIVRKTPRTHDVREGPGYSLHLRTLMTRYLLEHLPAGPR